MTLKNFVFNSINYLQKKGCTIGTKCESGYANIFMGRIKQNFIFSLLTNLSNFYLRFIDDTFLIWNGTKSEFDNFLKKINECHPRTSSEHPNSTKKSIVYSQPLRLNKI